MSSASVGNGAVSGATGAGSSSTPPLSDLRLPLELFLDLKTLRIRPTGEGERFEAEGGGARARPVWLRVDRASESLDRERREEKVEAFVRASSWDDSCCSRWCSAWTIGDEVVR